MDQDPIQQAILIPYIHLKRKIVFPLITKYRILLPHSLIKCCFNFHLIYISIQCPSLPINSKHGGLD